jgi:hypothetical protein
VLKTSSVVTAVDPNTATVTLEDGSSFSGDLVLGADGVSVSLTSMTLLLNSSTNSLLSVHHTQHRCRTGDQTFRFGQERVPILDSYSPGP